MAEAMGGDLVLKILQEFTSLKDEAQGGAARVIGSDRRLGLLTKLLGEMAEETRRRLSPDRRDSSLLEE